ncbi:unnamed protein product (mitochondrion) [Arabidopsis thaliana]|uniref:(thale cress) hypothetical protein n=1 Tax=Arabidopsis thaliana TaxID=3702 RepID=A0A7G2FJS0_ARATH|nr:unnamed protein product [Arabidopsis thaliana]CAD5336209.1 unnamed protein product [Arabidopsis thaliana]
MLGVERFHGCLIEPYGKDKSASLFSSCSSDIGYCPTKTTCLAILTNIASVAQSASKDTWGSRNERFRLVTWGRSPHSFLGTSIIGRDRATIPQGEGKRLTRPGSRRFKGQTLFTISFLRSKKCHFWPSWVIPMGLALTFIRIQGKGQHRLLRLVSELSAQLSSIVCHELCLRYQDDQSESAGHSSLAFTMDHLQVVLLRLRLDLVLAAFVQHEGGKITNYTYWTGYSASKGGVARYKARDLRTTDELFMLLIPREQRKEVEAAQREADTTQKQYLQDGEGELSDIKWKTLLPQQQGIPGPAMHEQGFLHWKQPTGYSWLVRTKRREILSQICHVAYAPRPEYTAASAGSATTLSNKQPLTAHTAYPSSSTSSLPGTGNNRSANTRYTAREKYPLAENHREDI